MIYVTCGWWCVGRSRGGPYQRRDFLYTFWKREWFCVAFELTWERKTSPPNDGIAQTEGCCSGRSGFEPGASRSEFKRSSNWDYRNGSKWVGGRGWAGGCMRMQHHGTGWRAIKGIRTKTLRTKTLWLRDCLHGGGRPQVGEVTRLSL